MGAKYRPTAEQRAMVESMSGFGSPQVDIACILKIDLKTLRLAFRAELDEGKAKANAKIGQCLFQQAMGGNVAAAIFWAKSQMGWREKQTIELTGEDGGPIKTEVVYRWAPPE